MDTTYLAYIAGIIDGEGSIHIERATIADHRTGDRYQLRVVVTLRERWLLEEFQAVFGGTVTTSHRTALHAPVGRWKLFDRGAGKLLGLISPHLRLKRAQAEIALEFRRSKESFVRGKAATRTEEQVAQQRSCYERIKALNVRGGSRLAP